MHGYPLTLIIENVIIFNVKLLRMRAVRIRYDSVLLFLSKQTWGNSIFERSNIMEQIFMLVLMVILIGAVVYFGIKESKQFEKEDNKRQEDLDRYKKKIMEIKKEYGELNYDEQPVMKIGEWEKEVRKNVTSIVDTKTKYKSNKELKVLVGDYNKSSVSNTTSVLESMGLNVTIANSGIEIIERIKNSEKYDLIISNIMTTARHISYKRSDWTQKRQEYTLTYKYQLVI